MTSAYDLLLKYVINLMKPKRPQVWRSIKTNNTAFKARVACMEGAKDILKRVGYSVVTDTAMQFPEDVVEPDRSRLEAIAAELLMAKLEVDEMNTQPPPRPHSIQQSPQLSQSRQQPNQYQYQGGGSQTITHSFQDGSSSYGPTGFGAFVPQSNAMEIEHNNQVPQPLQNWQLEDPKYVNLPDLQQHVTSALSTTPSHPTPHPDSTTPSHPTPHPDSHTPTTPTPHPDPTTPTTPTLSGSRP